MPPGSANKFFGQKVSKPGINVNSAGDNELIYKNDFSTTLYYDSSGVPTVLLGLRPSDSSQGLFVSKPGFDVTIATDSQLVFNSNQNIFKILLSGTTTIPSISIALGSFGVTGTVIQHNLGFTPVAQVYALLDTFVFNASSTYVQLNSYTPLPIIWGTGLNSFISVSSNDNNLKNYNIYWAADDNNLYITAFFTTTTAGGVTIDNIPITYYLLQESLSL